MSNETRYRIHDIYLLTNQDGKIQGPAIINKSCTKIKDLLTSEFDLLKKGNGIAFTIPISSVGGPATLQILSGMSFSGGKL